MYVLLNVQFENVHSILRLQMSYNANVFEVIIIEQLVSWFIRQEITVSRELSAKL